MRYSKYKAIRTAVDGIIFASKAEAARYCELKILQRQGLISDLRLQVPFNLPVNGVLICKYIADFVYLDADGRMVVEDKKGVKTPVYRLKSKLMLAVHGLRIVEV